MRSVIYLSPIRGFIRFFIFLQVSSSVRMSIRIMFGLHELWFPGDERPDVYTINRKGQVAYLNRAAFIFRNIPEYLNPPFL